MCRPLLSTSTVDMFSLNAFKMSSINDWDISLKQDNAQFKRYSADLFLSFRGNLTWPYQNFNAQDILRNVTPIEVGTVMNHIHLNRCHWTEKRPLLKFATGNVLFKSANYFNTLGPRRNQQNSADGIWNVFSSMKMFEFRLRFHRNLFVRAQPTTFQHLFR